MCSYQLRYGPPCKTLSFQHLEGDVLQGLKSLASGALEKRCQMFPEKHMAAVVGKRLRNVLEADDPATVAHR
jgi:hypothetical protein